jgi:hypothetical protein
MPPHALLGSRSVLADAWLQTKPAENRDGKRDKAQRPLDPRQKSKSPLHLARKGALVDVEHLDQRFVELREGPVRLPGCCADAKRKGLGVAAGALEVANLSVNLDVIDERPQQVERRLALARVGDVVELEKVSILNCMGSFSDSALAPQRSRLVSRTVRSARRRRAIPPPASP